MSHPYKPDPHLSQPLTLALRNELVKAPVPTEIMQLISDGALFAVGHSGGKDSQAMYIYLSKIVPWRQLVVVHADLGRIEWPGVRDHINHTTNAIQIIAKAVHKGGAPADFFSLIRRQIATHIRQGRPEAPPVPDTKNRFCTSDLKTNPIWRELCHYAKSQGFSTIVNCRGIRAGESSKRAKNLARDGVLKVNKKFTKDWRKCYDWDAIAYWQCSTDTNGQASDKSMPDVFEVIEAAGQEPHWAYADGNDRLSCMFCVFGSVNDWRHAATRYPEMYAEYVNFEKEIGFTMVQDQTMEKRTGIIVTDKGC